MIKCFLTILLQVVLIFMKVEETISKDLEVNFGNVYMNLARLISCLIMHLYLYPEIKVGLAMIQYAVNNSNKFMQGSCFFPMIIAICKFSGALLAEVGTAYFMLTYTSVAQIIGGYVKFSIVAKMDNIMAKTLTNINIGAEMSAEPIMMRKKVKVYEDYKLIKKWKKQGKMNVFQWAGMLTMLVINRVLKFLYVTVYFYFVPILVLIMLEIAYNSRPRLN